MRTTGKKSPASWNTWKGNSTQGRYFSKTIVKECCRTAHCCSYANREIKPIEIQSHQHCPYCCVDVGFHPSVTCLLVLLITCTMVTPLFAAVYKWVDENGKTHYSDKPIDEKAETIQIKNAPELDPLHHSRVEKQRRLLKMLDEERQEMKQNRADAAVLKRKRELNCARARKDLQDINNAGFLYKKSDDPKNPLIYSNEERARITDAAKTAVHHWCN